MACAKYCGDLVSKILNYNKWYFHLIFYTFSPEQNNQHFAHDILKYIAVNKIFFEFHKNVIEICFWVSNWTFNQNFFRQWLGAARQPEPKMPGSPYVDGLAQDCSNSIANALELLQSCTKPSMSSLGQMS